MLGIIDQYQNLEWFNNILAIIFYSQRITNLMINNSNSWNKSNRIFMILKEILTKYLHSPNILYALTKLINSYVCYKAIKFDVLNKTDLLFRDNDIIKLFKELNIKCLEITFRKGNNLVNLYKITDLEGYNSNLLDEYKIKSETENEIKNPDVLFIIHRDLNKSIYDKYKNFYDEIDTKNIFNLNNYGIDIYDNIFDKRNNNISEEIEFNSKTYILDSVIFKNNNHSLIGFTNNNQKFIYKGWFKKNYDPVNPNINNYIKNCEISPVNNFNFKYFLKENDCKLKHIDSQSNYKEYIFDISKKEIRDITLIYVIKDDKDLLKPISLDNKDNEVKHDDIIQDLYKIKQLNKEQIIYEIDLFNMLLKENYNYTINDLKFILYDMIKSHFIFSNSPLKSPLIKNYSTKKSLSNSNEKFSKVINSLSLTRNKRKKKDKIYFSSNTDKGNEHYI